METRLSYLVMLVALLLLYLSVHQFVNDQGHILPGSNTDNLSKPILQWLLPAGILQEEGEGIRSVQHPPSILDEGKKKKKKKKTKPITALGPNISACHDSFTDLGVSVNCCPSHTHHPFHDFDLPNLSSATIRVRRPAHIVTKDKLYVAKYQRAVALMKQLPSDHPHNFWRQANIHCLYCTGSFNQFNEDHIRLKIHHSWFFFPWHRMYLYFHERILGKLLGDDTFALPYWNWDNPLGMVIPDMYMNGSLFNENREKSHFPPHLTENDYAGLDLGLPEEKQIHRNLALMYNHMMSGAKKPELFFGCRLRPGEDGYCDARGTIERAPHDALHWWTGNNRNKENEDMGAFYSAGRDPLFMGHHANIDRLWTVWKEMHGKDRVEFPDPAWLDGFFFFHDENLQLVRVRVRDVLDQSKLGYRYEPDDMPWLDARPKPTVDPKIAKSMLKKREEDNNVLKSTAHCDHAAEFGPEGKVLDTIITAKVPRPVVRRRRVQEGEEEPEEVLVVYGIDVKNDMYVKFDVFINAVDETAAETAGPEAREFAGNFVNMRNGVRFAEKEMEKTKKKKVVLKLGISELLRELEAEEEENIWVSLVPRAKTGVNTTVDGIRIDHMMW